MPHQSSQRNSKCQQLCCTLIRSFLQVVECGENPWYEGQSNTIGTRHQCGFPIGDLERTELIQSLVKVGGVAFWRMRNLVNVYCLRCWRRWNEEVLRKLLACGPLRTSDHETSQTWKKYIEAIFKFSWIILSENLIVGHFNVCLAQRASYFVYFWAVIPRLPLVWHIYSKLSSLTFSPFEPVPHVSSV